MRKLSFVIFIIIVLHGWSYSQQGNFVHLHQNRLIDANGIEIKLNAVNLGGWLLWEGWIWGGGFTKESDIKERLLLLMGSEASSQFINTYYENFITETDIALIAQSGFNSIRLPFNYRLFELPAPDKNNGYVIIDRLLQWCRKYNLYLIPDMHAAPGGQNSFFISDPSKEKLWHSEKNKTKTVELWKAIAERYRNETVIAGYDILNEPDVNNTNELINLYKNIVSAIRSVDKNHLVIAEGNKLAKNFKGFPDSLDGNQVYSFHYYPWFAENNKSNNLQDILKQVPGKRPVWCGEWGEDTPQNLAQIARMFNANPAICGTSFWTWKRLYKNNGRMPASSVTSSAEWDKVARWLSLKLFKPGSEEIKKGTDDFLYNILPGNCILNKNVIDILSR